MVHWHETMSDNAAEHAHWVRSRPPTPGSIVGNTGTLTPLFQPSFSRSADPLLCSQMTTASPCWPLKPFSTVAMASRCNRLTPISMRTAARFATTPRCRSRVRGRRNGSQAILSRDPMPLTEEVVDEYWIEILRYADDRPRYSDRDQLCRSRPNRPDGEVLCETTSSPVCASCRALMNRSITGPFETWRAGIPYACLRGDIERTAGLAIEEGNTTTVRFKQWQPHPGSHDAVSSGSGKSASTRGR